MKQRGRKSTAELAVVGQAPVYERPEAPKELSDLEAAVWRDVVAAKPADWFEADSLPILMDYCRHVVRQNFISELINESRGVDLKEWDRLLRISERETKLIVVLATKMRLTQQSKYGPRAAHTASESVKGTGVPWRWGED